MDGTQHGSQTSEGTPFLVPRKPLLTERDDTSSSAADVVEAKQRKKGFKLPQKDISEAEAGSLKFSATYG